MSALDLSTRIHIVELLQRLAADMTLVFVSHDLGVVAALCEKMVIFERGRIVDAGATRKILAAAGCLLRFRSFFPLRDRLRAGEWSCGAFRQRVSG